jgi:DNA-binding NtrC family response regulator
VAHLGPEKRGIITGEVIAQGLQMRARFAQGVGLMSRPSEPKTPALAPSGAPGPLDGYAPVADQPPPSGPPSLRRQEADYINRLLRDHEGDRRRVAALLGISERTLYRKLARARELRD